MPQLVDGVWVKGDVAESEMKAGAFHREPTRFRRWITPDGSPGPEGQEAVKAEAGRFQLFVAYICPWASRTLMIRVLKGLQEAVPLAVAEPELGEDGWAYAPQADAGERVGPIRFQHQLYTASDPHYTGKVSVPVLWDRQEGRIVNNESADILRILNSGFEGSPAIGPISLHRPCAARSTGGTRRSTTASTTASTAPGLPRRRRPMTRP